MSGVVRVYIVVLAIVLMSSVASAATVDIDAPLTLSLWQRDNVTHGEIPISGTYTETASTIQARFNGSDWSIIDSSPSSGTFSGTLTASVGQGTLEVRCDAGTADTVANVAVGDLILITGQSNSFGEWQQMDLNSSNPYIATEFSHGATTWIIANDSGWWAPMLDILI